MRQKVAKSDIFRLVWNTDIEGKVIIDIVKTGANKFEKFVSYELEECLLSSYDFEAYSHAAPLENIIISFAKITMTYSAGNHKNKATTPTRVGYDLTVGKQL